MVPNSSFNQKILLILITAFVSVTVTVFLPKLYNYIFRGPETIEITQEQLINSLKNAGTFLQVDNLARELYYDKYVEWELTVNQVMTQEDNKANVLWSNGSALFNNSNSISSLKSGMKIIVIGKIVKIYGGYIYLENCKLKEIKTP